MRHRRAQSATSHRAVDGGVTAAQKQQFFEQGFLQLPGYLSTDAADTVNRAVDRAWDDKSIYNPLTVSAFTGTANYTETYLREAPAGTRDAGYKLNHLYLYDHSTMELLLGDRVQQLVSELIDGTPLLFNGLNLEYGSGQRFHNDTLYMPPRVSDKMVVVWFALEDITVAAGALRYYPKSHLIPPYVFSHGEIWALNDEMPAFDRYMDEQLSRRELVSECFEAKKGDAFVWHSQLYHGGSPILDENLTRRSMVAHFWRSEDVPAEWRWEARPQRFILDPRWMSVATSFASNGYSVSATTA